MNILYKNQAQFFSLLYFFLLMQIVGCASWFVEDPQKAQLYLNLGVSQYNQGFYPEALSSLIKSEAADPTNPLTQNQLGLVYYARDHYQKAEQHFRNAVHLKSEYTDARNNLGRILVEQDKIHEGIKVLEEAKADLTYPYPEKPITNLGWAYFKLGQFNKSKSILREAIKFQRENCRALTYYGRSLYELKEYQDATEALDKAVGLCQPNQFDEPHYYSALSYYQLDKRKEAESRLVEIIKLYPNGKYYKQSKIMLDTIRK